MVSFGSWKDRAKALKRETFTLYLACRHPSVPWYAKLLALIIVAYALSPIDLIPDFIPVLGYLDDLAPHRGAHRLADPPGGGLTQRGGARRSASHSDAE